MEFRRGLFRFPINDDASAPPVEAPHPTTRFDAPPTLLHPTIRPAPHKKTKAPRHTHLHRYHERINTAHRGAKSLYQHSNQVRVIPLNLIKFHIFKKPEGILYFCTNKKKLCHEVYIRESTPTPKV